jgi:hypothetical protein
MNSSAVEQDYLTGRTTPHTAWVVQSMTTVDSLAGTSSTTSHKYRSPRYHPDDQGNYGFRGFDEVDTTMASGAHMIQRYRYAPDWSGRLATSMLVAGSTINRDDTGPRTIEDTTWERRVLFGNVESFHATTSEHWTCRNGQDEDVCRADSSGYRRTEVTFEALASRPQRYIPANTDC